MKKYSGINFKQFFQKIYRDNLAQSSQDRLPANKSYRVISHNDKSLRESRNKCKYESKETRQGRPASSRVPIPYHRQMSSESVKYFNEIVENIKQEIIKKLKQKTISENRSLYQEVITLEKFCKNLSNQDKKSSWLLQKFQEDLSKFLQHRTTRILFYLLYSKYLQCNSQKDENKQNSNDKRRKNYSKELRYLFLCDQYGRILEVYYLSLYACNRIQSIFMYQKKYEESKEYARRFLRLAIFLNSPEYQFKAIQSLRIINYYCGIVNFSKNQYLGQRDRNGILKNYHPLNDKITNIGQLKYQSFQIERIPNQQDATVTKNIERFVTNLALMNKDLTDRSKNIVKTISKVNRVGSINKYFGSGLCITLQPRSRNLPDKNRGQILLTHTRKNSQLESKTKYYKFYFPKICSLIEALIQFSVQT